MIRNYDGRCATCKYFKPLPERQNEISKSGTCAVRLSGGKPTHKAYSKLGCIKYTRNPDSVCTCGEYKMVYYKFCPTCGKEITWPKE